MGADTVQDGLPVRVAGGPVPTRVLAGAAQDHRVCGDGPFPKF